MAAAYRIVVSSINCYNSVVVDRRGQQAVHYCTGPCQLLRHGLDCTVTHQSTCAELLEAPVAPAPCTRVSSEDYHQAYPATSRFKKASSIQSTASLKDITGEAINLASGKIKEFSFEKIKYSTSHVTFRKGRKVRPDSFSRRSTDLDIIYGHFGNDENCPPFGVMQKSVLEEHKLSRSTSLEHNLNNVATMYLNSLTEESLIAKILEKTKADSNASGEDIKACLDILLKCSEDLKKCTDIIKQCIQKKAKGGDGDDSGTPDVVYRSLMTRLSSYLRRLPLELEQAQAGRMEHSDFAELVSGLHSPHQGPFSLLFGNEQPPRYEDVVQSPPTTQPLSPSLSQFQESQKTMKGSVGNSKPAQSLQGTGPGTSTLAPARTVTTTRNDGFPCTKSLLSSSSDSISKGSMETLYIEEDADVGKVLDREGKNFGQGASRRQGMLPEPGMGSEIGRNRTIFKPNMEPLPLHDANKSCVPLKSMSSEHRSFRAQTSGRDDDIDKLLMDLECLSQTIDSQPCGKLTASDHRNGGQPASFSQSSTFGPESKKPMSIDIDLSSSPSLSKNDSAGPDDEDDGVLLLRILESIESFAQELVESGTGTGTQSKECEVMRLLQDTLASAGKAVTAPPAGHATISSRDTGSALLIQQTPEVIRVSKGPLDFHMLNEPVFYYHFIFIKLIVPHLPKQIWGLLATSVFLGRRNNYA